ncbi:MULTISPECIES: hypothetical protein [Mycolicibacterium]|uniref:Uncharacterized protein n=1 Tax=Mycolicibacterium llatzerense TaxID=280871 RepID=A0A0D1L8P8_9MYCO|nr:MULTISPECIES: hypothetical protein [Mycolicibacterium]KIU14617.1 hypothetical protein TL10_23410 [Mycolicibacterium llatzerense]MCT7372066.1 hypothetical protein [Mycolicibacterium llatzerense]WGI35906.1 hypothetical protein QDT91_27840 [Mycolicibacterium aubagnense]
MKKPGWLELAGALALIVIGPGSVLVGLTTAPRRDVPAWLHVSETDLTRCTIEVQTVLAVAIVCLGTFTVFRTVLGEFGLALRSALALVVTAPFVVLALPEIMLGTRHAAPDPDIPFPTDFDYRAYLPHLFDAVKEPALWSLTAAAFLGGVLGVAVRCWPRPAEHAPLSAGLLIDDPAAAVFTPEFPAGQRDPFSSRSEGRPS